MADQWSSPLDGQTAPIELLKLIGEKYDDLISEQLSPEFLTEVSTVSQRDRTFSQNEMKWLHERADMTPSERAPGWYGSPERTSREQQDVDEHASAAAPDMRRPAGAFEIRPGDRSQLAASMAVIDAAEEEDLSNEDLSVLSAKLKRILDEEARRHGIDV